MNERGLIRAGPLILAFVFATLSLAYALKSPETDETRHFAIDQDTLASRRQATERVVDTFTGTVSQGRDSTRHQINVPSGTAKIEAKLTMPSGTDFDFSVWDNMSRRTGGWTYIDHSVKKNIPNSVYSGYTANPEWINVVNPTTEGLWKIGCYAYSGSGTYTITVTVTPSAPDTTPPTVTITSPSNGATLTSSTVTVTWTGSDSGSGVNYHEIRMDSGSWINKSTLTSHSYTSVANGTHTVDVRAWDNVGNSVIASVTFNVNAVGGVMKYAVIVGISDYKLIGDLSYCDEDATDWYNHLKNTMAFNNIYVYGDDHVANYPKYDGLATEYNVKQALTSIVNSADSDDIICFISSGHGSGTGVGSSYLCMWDCYSGENGQNGNLYDTELADILEHAVASRIFVFLDHCFTGGFGDNLMGMPNKLHVFLTTTCTANGYGYDEPSYKNGAWTYFFLEYSWISHYAANPSTSVETIFAYAHANYLYGGGDEPQQYDGDAASAFYLSEHELLLEGKEKNPVFSSSHP